MIADAQGCVLVLTDDGDDRLPLVEVEGWVELDAIVRALAALVGFETVVVRTIARSVDEEQAVMELWLELEPSDEPATQRQRATWSPLAV